MVRNNQNHKIDHEVFEHLQAKLGTDDPAKMFEWIDTQAARSKAFDETMDMKSAAQGFAEAAEHFRLLYHREHCFTMSCCRHSQTVKILIELEKGEVTKARIKELLDKAIMDEKNEMDKLDDKIEHLSNLLDLFVGCDEWEDCANVGNETCLAECGTSAKFHAKKA